MYSVVRSSVQFLYSRNRYSFPWPNVFAAQAPNVSVSPFRRRQNCRWCRMPSRCLRWFLSLSCQALVIWTSFGMCFRCDRTIRRLNRRWIVCLPTMIRDCFVGKVVFVSNLTDAAWLVMIGILMTTSLKMVIEVEKCFLGHKCRSMVEENQKN